MVKKEVPSNSENPGGLFTTTNEDDQSDLVRIPTQFKIGFLQ